MGKWSVKIGINPISWTNDDLPHLGGETSLETALQEGATIGFQGFELGNKFPQDPPKLKNILANYNLECISGWYSGQLAIANFESEQKNCDLHMQKLAFNDCKLVVYGEVGLAIQGKFNVPLYKRPKLYTSKDWQIYTQKINLFGEFIKIEYGLILAYHHHMGAVIQGITDIDQLMALTNPEYVGLLFDSGHAYFGGVDDVSTLLLKHIDRVVHVHCKDVRTDVIELARNNSWSFMQSVLAGAYTVPGDGAINFNQILKILHEHNYQGWLVVEAEQDPAVAPSYKYAKLGYQTIKQIVNSYQ